MTESKLEQAAIDVVRAAFHGDQHPITALMGMSLKTQKLRLAICALADVLRDDDDTSELPPPKCFRDACRDAEKQIELPAEDPEEWVVQDRVPARKGIDQYRWVMNQKKIMNWRLWDWDGLDNRVHGYVDKDNDRLELRCRRKDLPPLPDAAEPINPNTDWVDITNRKNHVLRNGVDWFFVLDGKGWEVVDGYDGTTIDRFGVDDGSLIRCLRRDLPENLETPQRTRVRLWVLPSGTIILRAIAMHNDWREIHCDADGFYVD